MGRDDGERGGWGGVCRGVYCWCTVGDLLVGKFGVGPGKRGRPGQQTPKACSQREIGPSGHVLDPSLASLGRGYVSDYALSNLRTLEW